MDVTDANSASWNLKSQDWKYTFCSNVVPTPAFVAQITLSLASTAF